MQESHELDSTALTSSPGPYSSSSIELSLPKSQVVHPEIGTHLGRHLGKILLFVSSLYLFVLAITLMKEGARAITPLVRDTLAISNTANSLGFGWLSAYFIMSGSPVAAAALTFFNAGALDKLGAFAMITGSRLGAGFIVLLIGFLYVLRGRDQKSSLSMGLLTLTITATTYVPGLFLGALILHWGLLDTAQLCSGALLNSAVDSAIEPLTEMAVAIMPNWAIFLAGLGVILLSFNLFDKCLPQVTLKDSQLGWMSHLTSRPWIMFVLGALITLLSMSVSLSLSVLVPLSTQGFVRRESVTPYIMGANITTFVDTLLAAVLLCNPPAFTVVLVEMVSITLVSMLILTISYGRYHKAILTLVNWVTASNRNLAWFMALVFMVPIILILI